MFDYVRCEDPLPDGKPTPKSLFQTKDFPEPYMDHYTITASGRLIAHRTHEEAVPLEERPYPNETGFLKWVGSIRRVPLGDEDLNWHGYLNFYGSDAPDEWRDFRAKFTDGQLVEIVEIGEAT